MIRNNTCDVPCTPQSHEQTTAESREELATIVPAIDIYQSPDAIVLVADLPGVDLADVDIVLDRNVLTIRGRMSLPTQGLEHTVYTEFGTGQYERLFTVPNDIDREAIEASMKNGVLRLTLPKARHAQARKVTVQPAV